MSPPIITPDAHSAPAPALPGKRKPLDSRAALELRYMRILQANLAILRRRQLDERSERKFAKLMALWPQWLGILLGVFAPQLEALARSYGSWGMTLVFPFVELASRPEIQFGAITHVLPSILLFAQFPLEGLVAWSMLRRGIRPMRVAADMALIHCFGIVDLWLLSAGASVILMR